jgi:phosphate-selective porin OprO/OprP
MLLPSRHVDVIRAVAAGACAVVVWLAGTAADARGQDVTATRGTRHAVEALRMPVAVATEAQTPQSPPAEPSIYDRIWRFAEWYRNDDNPIVQRVQFSGRFQQDYARVNADQGDHDEWNVRRLRLGARTTLFRQFTFHGEAEFNPQEREPLYLRLTDFYLQWSRDPRLALTFGKQGVPFTSEGATSSRELVAIDRSNLANNIWFPQEYMPGVSVSGRVAPWVYRAGVYSSGAANREFGEFTGGVFTLALLGYDFGPALGLEEALVTGNYLYQQEDRANTFTRQLEHILSVHVRLEDEKWGTRADVSTATGYLGQSDLWSVMAMPFYNVTPAFQLVGRYTIVKSEEPNGVRLATYENTVVREGRGDRYREFYAGANYYFYGHRLKLQTGIQWGEMRDRANDLGAYSGVAWTSGVRVGW